MTAMVFGRIASMLDKQKYSKILFTLMSLSKLAINSDCLIEPSNKEENPHDTSYYLSHDL